MLYDFFFDLNILVGEISSSLFLPTGKDLKNILNCRDLEREEADKVFQWPCCKDFTRPPRLN